MFLRTAVLFVAAFIAAACDGTGQEEIIESDQDLSADTTKPAQIIDLRASSPSPTSITLTWTAPGDDGRTGTASRYDLRSSTSYAAISGWSGAAGVPGKPSPAPAGTVQQFTVTGLTPGTTYYFGIAAADEVPNWAPVSPRVSAKTQEGGVTAPGPDTTPPARVVNLVAESPTPNTLTLTWTSPGDDGTAGTAHHYDLRYSTSGATLSGWSGALGLSPRPTPLPGGTVAQFTVTGLSPGTTYYFGIAAADEVTNWAPVSNVASATTMTGVTTSDTTPPARITNLVASSPTSNSVTLSWTSPGDDGMAGTASRYDLRYAISSAELSGWATATPVAPQPVPAAGGTSVQFTVTGLNAGATYYFGIVAGDEVLNFAPLSNMASATTTGGVTPPPPPPPSTGRALYVDGANISASDSNSGTEANPWKTLQKAAASAIAGDTVYIKRATYSGNVNVANSGVAGAVITFRAYPGHEKQAILNGGGFNIIGKSYVTVSGLKVQNTPDRGILVKGPSSHVTISGNHTYNTWGSGIAAWGVDWGQDPGKYNWEAITDLVVEYNDVEMACNGGWNEMITFANGVARFEIRYNQVFRGGNATNGGEGIDVKEGCKQGKIHHNHVHDINRLGIYVDGGGLLSYAMAPTADIEIFANRVHATRGEGIAIVTEGKGPVKNIRVFNNIVTNATRNGLLVYKHPAGSAQLDNIQFMNNTAVRNGLESGHYGGGIRLDHPTATNVVVRNNIAFGNQDFQYSNNSTAVTMDHNLTGPDPLFVSADDFHVRTGSPAIDTGSPTGAPVSDFDGLARPRGSAFDIGAFEF